MARVREGGFSILCRVQPLGFPITYLRPSISGVSDNENKTKTEEPEGSRKTQNTHLPQHYKGTSAPCPHTEKEGGELKGEAILSRGSQAFGKGD